MSEKSRRQDIRAGLARDGHLVIPFPASPFAGRGVSDFLVCLYPSGLFCAIEVKDDDGRTTPPQEAFQRDVRVRGGIAFVAHTLSEAREEIKKAQAI